MPNFERVRRFYDLIWTVPGRPPILPPELPSTDDKKAQRAYERALEEHNQRKEARNKRHRDTSTVIRRIYYAILSTVLFCFTVMHGRKDLSFISNNLNIKLPIVNVDVSYNVFLLVAPSIIIGLTVYVHIFIEEHRKIAVEHEDRLATIFNMESISARCVSHVIFYWLPPLTLFYFAWNAQPLRLGGPILLVATTATVLILFVLQLRRTGRHLASTIFISFEFIIVVSICSFFYIQSSRGFSLAREIIVDQDLTIMNLAGASLEGAIMTRVDLNEVDLRGANLSGTTLRDVNLQYANLSDATLTSARLVDGTRLEFALLHGATLDGADLSGVLGLKAVQLNGACGDQFTRLPANITSRNTDFRLDSCDPRANEIMIGAAPVEGRIDQQNSEQQHTFGILNAGIYQIDVMAVRSDPSADFDPTITVRGPNLKPDLLDDDGGANLDSRIVSRLEPDLYTLIVTGYDGAQGLYSVKIGDWDERSISGFDWIKVPADEDITRIITVSKDKPIGMAEVRPTGGGLTWIELKNPQRRGIVITATANGDFDPLTMLFDANAAYAPIAYSGDGFGTSIRCSTGLERYLILADSSFDQSVTEVTVTVKLLDGSAKDAGDDCTAN